MPRDHSTDDLPRSPDEPASPAELGAAASFAAAVERLLAGEELPPAMASEERVLVEVATLLRDGGHGDAQGDAQIDALQHDPLDLSRRDALIADVLGRGPAATITAQAPAPATARARAENEPRGSGEPGAGPAPVSDLDAYRRRRAGRIVPWVVAAAAAAAAALMLFLQRPAPVLEARNIEPQPPMQHLSRPADPLIGQIPADRADRASERLDVIYSDRLAGYRDARLLGGFR